MKDRSMRKYIVYLKDECMLSFQEIANKLEREYNIKKSKQAIHGLYTREKNNAEESEIRISLIFDIVNLYILGYNKKEIESLMDKYNISYNQIRYIIQQNEDLIDHIRQCKVDIIMGRLDKIELYTEFINILKYNGIKPKESGLRSLLKEAYLNKIKINIKNELSIIENMDNAVAKEIKQEIQRGIIIK